MRILAAVLPLVWLLGFAQISSAHDPYFIKPDNGIDISILMSQLEDTIKIVSSLGNENGYLPTKDELLKIAEIFSSRGEVFNGGFVLKVGGLKKYDPTVYFFIFADGSIQWSIEEWMETSIDGDLLYTKWKFDEDLLYTRWKFRPDVALLTVSIRLEGGGLKDIFYEKNMSISSLDATWKSRYVLNTILSVGSESK